MNRFRCLALIVLVGLVSPLGASAMTEHMPVPQKVHKAHKVINSSRPGSPGYTNSSPLGSAEKADKRAKKWEIRTGLR